MATESQTETQTEESETGFVSFEGLTPEQEESLINETMKACKEYEGWDVVSGVGMFKKRDYLIEVGKELTDETPKVEKHLSSKQERTLKTLGFVFRSALGSPLRPKQISFYLISETYDLDGTLKDNHETLESRGTSDGTLKRLRVCGATMRKIKVRPLWENHCFRDIALNLPEPKSDNDTLFFHSALNLLDGWKTEIKFERIERKLADSGRTTKSDEELENEGAKTVTVILSCEWREKP